MLDKIQGNISETIAQSQGLEKIKGLGVTNPFEDDDKGFFIDQSDISSLAMQKYQREIDVNYFGEILKQTDEQEATKLVLDKVFNGQFSIDNDDVLMEILNSKDFLNDVFNE
ncbi:MAG: hypothetical protein IJD57_00525 [Candidatus Gastranaerophilales bacterium]|nr:hypothetical protein [Candidatus Gastranaerophilales bacterium]